MPTKPTVPPLTPEKLRWRLDPAALPFATTAELAPLTEIIGQQRGVEAFLFGIGMQQPGFNLFVTGAPGTGRHGMVKKLLSDMAREEKAPDDLCYVNNFKAPESPVLLRFKAGQGSAFRSDMEKLIETLSREVPDMIEEKIQEMIKRGTLLIDTTDAVVGQVNGLAVVNLGDYQFGYPSRITATSAMGREGVINIEREAELAGSIHNKGVYILAGYLRRNYAQDKPLSISASIAFEQSYGGVDGDSASSTELYALLSSLAGVPINQAIAVTGSVNQKGEVQAIGGVNEKVEGFFDICRQQGELNGSQGVLIPASNVRDLMLRQDVVEAAAAGLFHVWAVRTIDEGLTILTGREAGTRDAKGEFPAGSINAMVDARLRELAEGLQRFAEASTTGTKKRGRARKGGVADEAS